MSDNLKLPAYPTLFYNEVTGAANGHSAGFTKLELASLMIAQGICAETCDRGHTFIASESVKIAKAVLEEANK